MLDRILHLLKPQLLFGGFSSQLLLLHHLGPLDVVHQVLLAVGVDQGENLLDILLLKEGYLVTDEEDLINFVNLGVVQVIAVIVLILKVPILIAIL